MPEGSIGIAERYSGRVCPTRAFLRQIIPHCIDVPPGAAAWVCTLDGGQGWKAPACAALYTTSAWNWNPRHESYPGREVKIAWFKLLGYGCILHLLLASYEMK